LSLMASWIVASTYLMAYVGWILGAIAALLPLFATLTAGALLQDVRKSLAAGVITIVLSFVLVVLLLALPVVLGQISDPELAGFFVDSTVVRVATATGPVPLHIVTLAIVSLIGSIVGGMITGGK